MAGDSIVNFGDQRKQHRAFRAQILDEIRFVLSSKRSFIHFADLFAIVSALESNRQSGRVA